jgi:hypothetical protein
MQVVVVLVVMAQVAQLVVPAVVAQAKVLVGAKPM